MMEDSVSTAGALVGLRSLGVRLSVDDFGTGFSSLSTLKRFPVSGVKIDRSFVSGLGHRQSDSSLVAAILAMAAALGLVTIAEGRRDERTGEPVVRARLPRGAGISVLDGGAVRRHTPNCRSTGVPGHAEQVRVP